MNGWLSEWVNEWKTPSLSASKGHTNLDFHKSVNSKHVYFIIPPISYLQALESLRVVFLQFVYYSSSNGTPEQLWKHKSKQWFWGGCHKLFLVVNYIYWQRKTFLSPISSLTFILKSKIISQTVKLWSAKNMTTNLLFCYFLKMIFPFMETIPLILNFSTFSQLLVAKLPDSKSH